MKRYELVIRQLEKLCGDIELVSYGLAPNPNGFCYEILNDSVLYADILRLDKLLDELSPQGEKIIRELYL